MVRNVNIVAILVRNIVHIIIFIYLQYQWWCCHVSGQKSVWTNCRVTNIIILKKADL